MKLKLIDKIFQRRIEMRVVCVAIVGKLNNLLYLQSFDSPGPSEIDNELRFNHTIYSALDIIEDKLNAENLIKKKDANVKYKPEMFMDRLTVTPDDCVVFGYVTNTLLKLFVIISEDYKLNDVKNFFRSIHNLYSDLAQNPFYSPGEPIKPYAKRFHSDLLKIIEQSSQ